MLHRQGSALLIAIVLLSIIVGTSVSLVNYSTLSNRVTTSIDYYTEARHTAEAGLEKALWCIRQTVGTNCGGTYGGSYAGESNIPFGPGVFSVTVTAIDSMTKKVESTGYIPNAVNPKKKVTLRTNIEINSQGIGLTYAMQVGLGGVVMDSNSKITGNIVSAGSITGNDNTEITGDVLIARTIALFKDQEWTAINTDFSFGKTNTPERYIAQSFILTTSSLANSISLYIKKVGSPATLNIWLARDNNGEPLSSHELVGTINASSIATNYAWVQTAVTNIPLLIGKTYWLLLGPSSSSASNYYTIGFDNTNAYGNGTLKASPSKAAGSWVAQNGDINFAVYVGGVDTFIDKTKVGGSAETMIFKNGEVSSTLRTKTLITDSTVKGNAYAMTINNSTVNGNAYATTITNSTIVGTTNSGSGIDPPFQVDFPFTIDQINEWKAAAAVGGVQNGDYTLTNNQNAALGPKKIIGNMNLSNNVTITLTGAIHITGNLILDNNVIIKLDPSYGSLSGMLIVDGVIDAGNNVDFKGSGQAGSYILAAAMAQDNGTYDSSAISISNNITGVIFFAPYGMVKIDNNAGGKQITGLKIKLENNATIVYESGLLSAEFSTGPQAGWAVVPGTFQEIR